MSSPQNQQPISMDMRRQDYREESGVSWDPAGDWIVRQDRRAAVDVVSSERSGDSLEDVLAVEGDSSCKFPDRVEVSDERPERIHVGRTSTRLGVVPDGLKQGRPSRTIGVKAPQPGAQMPTYRRPEGFPSSGCPSAPRRKKLSWHVRRGRGKSATSRSNTARTCWSAWRPVAVLATYSGCVTPSGRRVSQSFSMAVSYNPTILPRGPSINWSSSWTIN